LGTAQVAYSCWDWDGDGKCPKLFEAVQKGANGYKKASVQPNQEEQGKVKAKRKFASKYMQMRWKEKNFADA
jgi:hypothetical protein